MTVRLLQILVLEERRGRQHNISVVGRVGEELLVHHGEQIRTPQPANHLIMIRANRRRIGVVHKKRFHRRIVGRVQNPS